MKNKFSEDSLYIAVMGLLSVVVLLGWMKNVVKLSDCDFQEPYKCEVIHGVGLIPFVGSIVGWMDFGK